MMPIFVLIAGGNKIWRCGLRELMATDVAIQLVGEVDSLPGLLSELHSRQLDVVVMDNRLPPSGGIYATRELKRRICSPPKSIVLGDSVQDAGTEPLLSGVDGYLPKDTPYEELREAIRRVHGGETLASSRQIADLVDQFQAMAQEHVLLQMELSDTELRILEHLACGQTYEEIGGCLYLSRRTVMRKVQSAMTKLDANNRTHAVARAIRQGLI